MVGRPKSSPVREAPRISAHSGPLCTLMGRTGTFIPARTASKNAPSDAREPQAATLMLPRASSVVSK